MCTHRPRTVAGLSRKTGYQRVPRRYYPHPTIAASHGAANGSAGKSTARHAGGGLSELDWTGQAGGRRDELSGGGPRRTVEKMNAERRSESGADRLPAFSSHYGRAAAPNRDRSIGN